MGSKRFLLTPSSWGKTPLQRIIQNFVQRQRTCYLDHSCTPKTYANARSEGNRNSRRSTSAQAESSIDMYNDDVGKRFMK